MFTFTSDLFIMSPNRFITYLCLLSWFSFLSHFQWNLSIFNEIFPFSRWNRLNLSDRYKSDRKCICLLRIKHTPNHQDSHHFALSMHYISVTTVIPLLAELPTFFSYIDYPAPLLWVFHVCVCVSVFVTSSNEILCWKFSIHFVPCMPHNSDGRSNWCCGSI